MDFIDKYNILSPEQFEFTTNSSTELAITTIYDKFLDNLDKNQYKIKNQYEATKTGAFIYVKFTMSSENI